MLALLERPDARLVARRWAARNRAARFALDEGEVQYMTAMALGADDDLVAHMLLAKLRLATTKAANDDAGPVARIDSVVAFAIGDGEARTARLAHPTAPRGTSITSLIGAGLIGLGEGQAIAWPDTQGAFHPLTILRIADRECGETPSTTRKE